MGKKNYGGFLGGMFCVCYFYFYFILFIYFISSIMVWINSKKSKYFF